MVTAASPPAWADAVGPAARRIAAAPVTRRDGEPGRPDVSDSRLVPINDDAGEIAGGILVDGNRGTIWLGGTGRFEFDLDSGAVECVAPPGTSDRLIGDAWARMGLPAALNAAGEVVLHAAAFGVPDGVVALVGPSGTGKSTLAASLNAAGLAAFADDSLVIVNAAGGSPGVAWLPFALRPRGVTEGMPPADPSAGVIPALLAAVAVRPSGGGPAVLSRLDGAAAYAELLRNSHLAPPYSGDTAEEGAEKLLALSARTPVHELRISYSGRAEPATAGALICVLRSALRASEAPVPSRRTRARALLRHYSRDPAGLIAAARIWARFRLLRLLRPVLATDRLIALGLGRPRRRRKVPGAGAAVRALVAAHHIFPPGIDADCNERSLAVAAALRRLGHRPEVVFGWAASSSLGHAWVELDGLPVFDDRGEDVRFSELTRFGGLAG